MLSSLNSLQRSAFGWPKKKYISIDFRFEENNLITRHPCLTDYEGIYIYKIHWDKMKPQYTAIGMKIMMVMVLRANDYTVAELNRAVLSLGAQTSANTLWIFKLRSCGTPASSRYFQRRGHNSNSAWVTVMSFRICLCLMTLRLHSGFFTRLKASLCIAG